MNRQEKEYFVNDFHSKIENAKVLLISHYKGLSVSDISDLRKTVKDNKASFKVTKNSLVKIALKDTCYQSLEKHFHGPVAVTYSDDPASCAKAVFDFAKNNENLKIIGGAIGNKELSVDEIKTLASLPSLDELRAKIVGLISSPLSNIVRIISEPQSSLTRLINNKPEENNK